MRKVDVVIVGAATTGSFFARRMAERGHSVLVIDRLPMEKVGTKYDIFHMGRKEFDRFGLPLPEKGDDYAFEFSDGANYSAFGRYPKRTKGTTIGMHMHAYTMRMNRWAAEAGAEFQYGAEFVDFLYEGDRIAGVKYRVEGREESVGARIVCDCSGIPSVARTRLPDGYGVENAPIAPTELFYVTLRYVRYSDEKDYVRGIRSWPFYKTWEAPQADPHGAILGVGANFSYDFGEKVFREFESKIPLPKYEVVRTERGMTPYRRPPYSFVADGFIVMGDAAYLTKPHAGEGVTSSMVQAEIAADVIDKALREEGPITRAKLWSINKRYIEEQGKTYAGILATLVGAVSTSAKENDFFFSKDLVFSTKSFESMNADQPLKFSSGEMAAMAFGMLGGVITGRLKVHTIRSLLNSMKNSGRVTELYAAFPETEEGFDEWARKADVIWDECGSMADAAKA